MKLSSTNKTKRVYPLNERQPVDGSFPFTEKYESKCFAEQGLSSHGLSRVQIEAACMDYFYGARRAQLDSDRVEVYQETGQFFYDDDLHNQLREGERDFVPEYDFDTRWSFASGENSRGWTSRKASAPAGAGQ